MLGYRFLSFHVVGADALEHTLRHGTAAFRAHRKHDHAIIDFDEQRATMR